MATPSSGGTFSVTKPAGTSDGDVGFILCSASDGINGLSSPGWTQDQNVAEAGDDSGMWVGWKAFSGEGASWTLTSTGGENIAWYCVVFRGVDNTSPIGAKACASKASASAQVCGPITVTDTGAWILCAAECDLTGSPTYSGPGGAFNFDGYSVHSTAKNLIGVGYEDLAGATGATSRTLTCSTADVYVAGAWELIPAAGAAAATSIAFRQHPETVLLTR